MWHISRNKPEPIKPLCEVAMGPEVCVMRAEDYEKQPDPWLVWGAPVCDVCAREAAKL